MATNMCFTVFVANSLRETQQYAFVAWEEVLDAGVIGMSTTITVEKNKQSTNEMINYRTLQRGNCKRV